MYISSNKDCENIGINLDHLVNGLIRPFYCPGLLKIFRKIFHSWFLAYLIRTSHQT